MSKASEEKLSELHGQLAETLTDMIQVRTVTKYDKEGEAYDETVEPSPAALAVAAKFLKDNNITATPSQSGAVDELKDKLAKRRPSRQDLKDAMRGLGNELLQ